MSFDTPLTPQEETQFSVWKQQHAPRDSGADYDLRGAFKAGLQPDPVSGHWPDTYKKPNHETFSDESIYSSLTGTKPGTWQGPNRDVYVPMGTGQKMNSTLQDLPGILSKHSRMLAIQNSGGDYDTVTKNFLSSGPFADAAKRQAAWESQPIQVAGNDSQTSQLYELQRQEDNRVNQSLPGEPPRPIARTPYVSPGVVDMNAQAAQFEAQDKARATSEKNAARLKRNKLMGLPLNTP